MQSILQRLSNWLKGKEPISLNVRVILFTITVYLIRAGGYKFALFMESLSILVVFFCVIMIPIIGFVVFLAGLLVYKVIRHGLDKNGSPIPLLILIGGIILAIILPLPPLPEEIAYIRYQKDYEYIVTLAKSHQYKNVDDCVEVPEGYEHLSTEYQRFSKNCISVIFYTSGNINVEFNPYEYAVVLNYFENPDDVKKSRDCDFRGQVWKQINEHWFVCKLSHTW